MAVQIIFRFGYSRYFFVVAKNKHNVKAKGQNIEEKVGGVGTKLEGKVGENCKNGASDLCRWNLRNESLGNGK